MTDTPETAEESAARRTRRRWITLGEGLAVAAVLISALSLWNAYSQRTHSEAEQAAGQKQAAAKAATLLLKATPADEGRRLSLEPLNPAQSIQSQTIAFPKALGVAPVNTTGDARIEVRWFEEGLKRARKAAGLEERSRGDERLPVLLTTRYLADGAPREDVALYDVGYRISGRFLGGNTIRLRGLSLQRRLNVKTAPAALDAAWRGRG